MPGVLPTSNGTQILVCIAITAFIGIATWLKVRQAQAHDGSTKDVFLAGGGLSWLFIAGSITLTNLSTDQLVGMNGNVWLMHFALKTDVPYTTPFPA